MSLRLSTPSLAVAASRARTPSGTAPGTAQRTSVAAALGKRGAADPGTGSAVIGTATETATETATGTATEIATKTGGMTTEGKTTGEHTRTEDGRTSGWARELIPMQSCSPAIPVNLMPIVLVYACSFQRRERTPPEERMLREKEKELKEMVRVTLEASQSHTLHSWSSCSVAHAPLLLPY